MSASMTQDAFLKYLKDLDERHQANDTPIADFVSKEVKNAPYDLREIITMSLMYGKNEEEIKEIVERLASDKNEQLTKERNNKMSFLKSTDVDVMTTEERLVHLNDLIGTRSSLDEISPEQHKEHLKLKLSISKLSKTMTPTSQEQFQKMVKDALVKEMEDSDNYTKHQRNQKKKERKKKSHDKKKALLKEKVEVLKAKKAKKKAKKAKKK